MSITSKVKDWMKEQGEGDQSADPSEGSDQVESLTAAVKQTNLDTDKPPERCPYTMCEEMLESWTVKGVAEIPVQRH